MNRISVRPRANWRNNFKELLGLPSSFDPADIPWNDEAVYAFSRDEIDTLGPVTNQIDVMVGTALRHLVDSDLWHYVGITDQRMQDRIKAALRQGNFDIIRRYDLIFGQDGIAKLHDINANAVGLLPETAALQNDKILDLANTDIRFSNVDQINGIPDAVADRFAVLRDQVNNTADDKVVWFATYQDDYAGQAALRVLQNCAEHAGLRAFTVNLEGLHSVEVAGQAPALVCGDEDHPLYREKIDFLYLQVPFEELMRNQDPLADIVLQNKNIQLLEPLTSVVIGNKGFLRLLYELFPDSPYLLPTYDSPEKLQGQAFIRKPTEGMSGEGITVYNAQGEVTDETAALDSAGHSQSFIYQPYVQQGTFEGRHITVSMFSITGTGPAGIAVRESDRRIIGDGAKFVPHCVYN